MKRTRLRILLSLLLCTVTACALALAYVAYLQPGENYTRIEDGLYVGGHVANPPPGATAVLNLCEQADPYEADAHRWNPIVNLNPGPDVAWIAEVVAFIEAQRRAGRTVYVHCQNGVNRGPFIATAFLMKSHGWSRAEAFAFLHERRPNVRSSPAFTQRLTEWEEVCVATRGTASP